jgi:hypothetical protein
MSNPKCPCTHPKDNSCEVSLHTNKKHSEEEKNPNKIL